MFEHDFQSFHHVVKQIKQTYEGMQEYGTVYKRYVCFKTET